MNLFNWTSKEFEQRVTDVPVARHVRPYINPCNNHNCSVFHGKYGLVSACRQSVRRLFFWEYPLFRPHSVRLSVSSTTQSLVFSFALCIGLKFIFPRFILCRSARTNFYKVCGPHSRTKSMAEYLELTIT